MTYRLLGQGLEVRGQGLGKCVLEDTTAGCNDYIYEIYLVSIHMAIKACFGSSRLQDTTKRSRVFRLRTSAIWYGNQRVFESSRFASVGVVSRVYIVQRWANCGLPT